VNAISRKRREMRHLVEKALKEQGKIYTVRQRARQIVATAHREARTK
jgi:hypothetical protein